MKITDIKQQVKTAGRYSVYIDDKFAFGLSENGLLASGLRIGQEITGTELDQLKDSAREDKAYNNCLNLIVRRMRSEWEITDYLKQKKYEPELISQLVAKLKNGGWVDDREFARRWIANRRLLKPTSKRRLIQELKAKRVGEDIIRSALSDDETDEKEVLSQVVATKRKQSRYQDDQKLMAYLMRQGYNYQDVKDALKIEEEY